MGWRKTLVCVVLLIVLLLFVFMKLQFGYKHTLDGDDDVSKHTVEGDKLTTDVKHTIEGNTSDSKHTIKGNISDPNHTMEGNTNDFKRVQQRLLYATQTESCLPIHLQEALGNRNECNCDVLALSYKKSCKAVFPPHIKHIDGYSLTWPEGRNWLLQVAKSWHIQYLYYIFIDDDMNLTSTKGGNPWRQFERFLVSIEPAVAGVDTNCHPFIPAATKAIKYNKCVVDNNGEYITAARFDEAFNAFHYQAVDHVLPYSTNHTKDSWWFSSMHFAVKCEVTFRGHMVIPTQLRALNPLHRRYPRKRVTNEDIVNFIVPEVAEEIPSKYSINSVLMGWKRDGMRHESISSTYCLPPPPPHMPIKPFALLEAPIKTL